MKYKVQKATPNKKVLLIIMIVIASILAITAITFLVISLVDNGGGGADRFIYHTTGTIDFNDNGLPDVKVKYGEMSTSTDNLGKFSFTVYSQTTITFEKVGFTFEPSSIVINQENQVVNVKAKPNGNLNNYSQVVLVDFDGNPINVDVNYTCGGVPYTFSKGNSNGVSTEIKIGDIIIVPDNEFITGASYRIDNLSQSKIIIKVEYKKTNLTLQVVDKNGNALSNINAIVGKDTLTTDSEGKFYVTVLFGHINVVVIDPNKNYGFAETYSISKQDNNRKIVGEYVNKADKIIPVTYSFVDNTGKAVTNVYLYISQKMFDYQDSSIFSKYEKVGEFYKFAINDKLIINDKQKQFSSNDNFLIAYAIVGEYGYVFKIYNSGNDGIIVGEKATVFKGTVSACKAEDNISNANLTKVFITKLGVAYECVYDQNGVGSFSLAVLDNDVIFNNEFLLQKDNGKLLPLDIWKATKPTELVVYLAKRVEYSVEVSYIEEYMAVSEGSSLTLTNSVGQAFECIVTYNPDPNNHVQNTIINLYEGADLNFLIDKCSAENKIVSIVVDETYHTIKIVVTVN
ncbi:MAG: hypothetical protein RR248_05815 [Clostridia bacterium]